MLIQKLKLYTTDTAAHLAYWKNLGFQAERLNKLQIEVKVGNTFLSFQETGRIPKGGVYHYAFNIPFTALDDCLRWAEKKRLRLLGKEGWVYDFVNWKARAFYFQDPDGNIGEFIARRRLDAHYVGGFDAKDVLSVGEIGCATFLPADVKDKLIKAGLGHFDGDSLRFNALGDDKGLVILVDAAQKKWMPTDASALPMPFDAVVHCQNGAFNMLFNGLEDTINVHEEK